MSMKPGAITSPFASTVRFAWTGPRLPTALMRSPVTHTSALNHGAPVPSTTRPPVNNTSHGPAASAAVTPTRIGARKRSDAGRMDLLRLGEAAERLARGRLGLEDLIEVMAHVAHVVARDELERDGLPVAEAHRRREPRR